jgi:hypothetical protein
LAPWIELKSPNSDLFYPAKITNFFQTVIANDSFLGLIVYSIRATFATSGEGLGDWETGRTELRKDLDKEHLFIEKNDCKS